MHKLHSLSVYAGITGSLLGTSSYATVAQNVLGSIESASYAGTASVLLGSIESASYALTASYAENGGASEPAFPYTGSAIISGSLNVVGTLGITGSAKITTELSLGGTGHRAGASYWYFPSPSDSNGIASVGSVGGSYIYSNAVGHSFIFGGGWEFDSVSSGHRSLTGVRGTLRGRPAFTGSGTAEMNMFRIGGNIGESENMLWNSTEPISALNVITTFTASADSTGRWVGARIYPQISGSQLKDKLTLLEVGYEGIPLFAVSSSGDVQATKITATQLTGSLFGTSSQAVTSSFAETSSYAVTASYATAFDGFVNFPDGLVVTGSLNVSGSITGSLLGTSSWTIEAISSSVAISSSFASQATTASYFAGYITFPAGLDVTGSTNLNGNTTIFGTTTITGSLLVSSASNFTAPITASAFSGPLTGSVFGTSSWATTASAAESITFTPATASYAVSASFAPPTITFPYTGSAIVSGSLIVTGSTSVQGAFTATTKSFLIDHQRLLGKKLVYGVVEAPEHSVLVRGKLSVGNIITLPEEWEWLVDMDTITVQLTPIGTHQALFVDSINGQQIHIGIAGQWNSDIHCYYLVQATRKDVPQLDTVV